MAITAAMVKELREMTGAGMMECKKALTEVDGDVKKAVDVLRTKGLAAVAKKAGRATNEGRVLTLVSPDHKHGVVVELNCETDFVAMNEKFQGYAQRVAQAALEGNPSSVEELMECTVDGETVKDIITDAIHVMGENTKIARFDRSESGFVATYVHGGKIGVLVELDIDGVDVDNPDFVQYGKDVAMQVASAVPISATRDDVPADVVEHEMNIYKAQAAESGKPEQIQEKIATGRMNKFYKERCLTEQEFVKDPDKTIQKYTDEVAKKLGGKIKIVGFKRIQLGE